MKKAWLYLADRFNACQPRERVALFSALAALLVGGFVLFVFNPAYARYQAAKIAMQAAQAQLREVEAERLALLVAASQDPDAPKRSQIAAVEKDNAAMRQRMLQANEELVSAQEMTGILQQLMETRGGLAMVSMKTLQPEDMFGDPKANDSRASLPDVNGVPMSLYRHGLELTVSGTYAELVTYLRVVEGLPRKVHVQDVAIHTNAYPVAEMKISLYTLSLERTWLSM